MAKAIDRDGTFKGIYQHNQTDLEFVRAPEDDGPATLLQIGPQIQGELYQVRGVTGDWNGDGRDTAGLLGDADADGDMDGADFV